MHTNKTTPVEQDFMRQFTGGFTGILYWEQLDQLWEQLRADQELEWYVYAVGEMPPQQPVPAAKLQAFISRIDHLLRTEHDYDYCGVVYVDSRTHPGLIKIFDPNQLGSSCGSSGLKVLPGWVLSRTPPVDLQALLPPPRSRRRWWQALFPEKEVKAGTRINQTPNWV